MENYLFLKNYVTSEGAVSHNVLNHQQLSIACYQVSFYAMTTIILSNYQKCPVPLKTVLFSHTLSVLELKKKHLTRALCTKHMDTRLDACPYVFVRTARIKCFFILRQTCVDNSPRLTWEKNNMRTLVTCRDFAMRSGTISICSVVVKRSIWGLNYGTNLKLLTFFEIAEWVLWSPPRTLRYQRTHRA